jgi:hypothetical protein
MGGLGNQMFQYALGRRLALDRNVPLKLYLNWYEKVDDRRYELDQLNINAEIASYEEFFRLTYYSRNWFTRKLYKIYQYPISYYRKRYVIEQEPRKFDSNILHVPKTAYLNGYWACERYFEPIQARIRQEFSPSIPLSESHQKLSLKIQNDPSSVSVHIRRGDYVSLPGFLVLPIDYYQRAAVYINQYISSPHFYIFSDDIEWVKVHLKLNSEMTFIEPSAGGKDLLDMQLMSQCRHHINANSSFSWWGAWLGEKSDGIVIVPNQWHANKPYPEDLIPDRWIRI